MSFLERTIRRAVSKGVGNAIGNAVQKAVEPKATELANQAAQHIDNATQSVSRSTVQQNTATSSEFRSAFSNLERSMQDYATEKAKNIKICPSCGEATSAEKKFCPSCGTKLPEQTVAQGAVCTSCGKQNSIGTKFCSDCGAKLPAAIAEEQAAADRDAAVMTEWDERLPQYPKWSCGGTQFDLEEYDPGYFVFSADFNGNREAAHRAVSQYRQMLLQYGFRQAGQYPSMDNLYKRIDGVVYHVDTEHCFEGDQDHPSIGFDKSEPYGGFDYVKPEPKKKASFKNLLGL